MLDGVFQDEHGDFPVGSYIRNPPTSSHTPGSETGCTIFVKLWQFDPTDRKHVRIDTSKLMFTPLVDPDRKGVETMGLFADKSENVGWSVGLRVPRSNLICRSSPPVESLKSRLSASRINRAVNSIHS